jgi:hypothetical protein
MRLPQSGYAITSSAQESYYTVSVTGDETWVSFLNVELKQIMSAIKIMVTVF